MKRYLFLGTGQLDIKWLEIDSEGKSTTHHQSVPIKIYTEMPTGYVGPAKGYTINAQFAPFSMEVPAGQWLTIVPETKLPQNIATITLP